MRPLYQGRRERRTNDGIKINCPILPMPKETINPFETTPGRQRRGIKSSTTHTKTKRNKGKRIEQNELRIYYEKRKKNKAGPETAAMTMRSTYPSSRLLLLSTDGSRDTRLRLPTFPPSSLLMPVNFFTAHPQARHRPLS